MKAVIGALLVLFVVRTRGDGVKYPSPMCSTDPQATVGPNDPRLPQVMPPEYQVHIEGAIIDQFKTVVADEYVSISEGVSAMTVTLGDNIEYFILNYNTNESYHIINGACTVYNQSMDPDDVFLGGSSGKSAMPHGYSTGSVLRFAQRYGEVYIGQSTVRGIQCDHWQSCMYWGYLGVNFTLDYYFSVTNWTTSDNSPQIPVRAEIVGYQNLLGPGVGSSFHHIYDYTGYRSEITDESKLETPKGIACMGRKQTRDMPQLQAQYQYREEITSVMDNTVTQADVYYDYNYQLIRFDSRPGPVYPYYSTDATVEIHDYNTGVAYVIDRTFLNCSIVPIENTTWDATRNMTSVPINLRKPEQLFYLNPSYSYSGQRSVRGIDCDVYSTIRTDFPERMGANVSFEVYFMSDYWTSSNDIGSDSDSPDTPVRLEISEPLSGLGYIYDFYDFDQETPNVLNAFGITPCFTDEQQTDFQITFPGDASEFLSQYRTVLQAQIVAKISTLTNMSPIRIQRSSIHWDEDNTYFLATFLDKAPAIAKFRRWPNLVAQYKDDVTLTGVTDAFTCASACDTTKATCNSFDICPGAQTCAQSTHYTPDGTQLSTSATCDHYSRVLSGPVQHEIALQDAYEVLKDYVFTNALIVTLKQTNRVFKASSITTDIIRNPFAGSTNKVTALSQFISETNKAVRGSGDMQLTGMAVDSCASECVAEIEFTCQSFEYCLTNGMCTLSRVHPDERPDLIVNNASCNLYIRDYTAKFTELKGTTVVSDSDTIYQNINTPNQCAKLCTDYQSFPCKSFDFCPNINACFLGHTHVFDTPKGHVKQDPTCNHYSRNYADDFKQTANRQISLQDNRIILMISVEQCAKLCVDEETFSCASFDYCGNTTECRLSTASMSDVGQITIESTAYCSIYNRQYYPNGQRYIPHQDTSAKYTSGAMGGLGFAMLVVGLLIGFGALFAWTKCRGGHSDEMAVSFSSKDTLSAD
ncbi:uncharacterized protein LOC124115364 [Haliotis rufescens]|uniref:uncharacterized protein LOC124115364 n=1 Tax=Haliotis rufescens TaxID=6454 RepID=UPI00201EE72A|nr:uncharacterized protein LOC124115364 [Haliotis rufescens]